MGTRPRSCQAPPTIWEDVEMGTEQEYAEAATWAEREMTLPRDSASAVRGDQAAEYGRSVLARALARRRSIDPDPAGYTDV